MKKFLKWFGIGFGIFVSLFFCTILILGLIRPLIFSEFEKNSDASINIPGLKQDYTPQGLAYSKDKNLYLFCGYMNDKSNSKIFVCDQEGNIVKEVNLLKEDQSKYSGHAGGIAVLNDDIYLSNASEIFHLSLTKLLECENKGSIAFDGSFKVSSRASYCFVNEDYLFVGEYFDSGNKSYKTDESHHFSDGKIVNQAICLAYSIIDSKEMFNVDYNSPSFVLSLPGNVQGICQIDQQIVLSRSSGISFSKLDFYDLESAKEVGEFKEAKVYFLSNDNLTKRVKMPPMSEDIDVKDGKIIINFESACKKYSLFNIWKTKKVMEFKY